MSPITLLHFVFMGTLPVEKYMLFPQSLVRNRAKILSKVFCELSLAFYQTFKRKSEMPESISFYQAISTVVLTGKLLQYSRAKILSMNKAPKHIFAVGDWAEPVMGIEPLRKLFG